MQTGDVSVPLQVSMVHGFLSSQSTSAGIHEPLERRQVAGKQESVTMQGIASKKQVPLSPSQSEHKEI